MAHFFAGFVLSSSSICKPEREKIASLIIFFGGEFQVVLDRKCTHLIVGRCGGVITVWQVHYVYVSYFFHTVIKMLEFNCV